jgi:hypothetical protein
MQPYMLFAGNDYYPSGGAKDFQCFFDSVDDAITYFEQRNQRIMGDIYNIYLPIRDWYQVVQSNDMSIVTESNFWVSDDN